VKHLKPGEAKIMQTLTNNLEGLTFKQIETCTKLSHTAVAHYLNDLLSAGVIRKDYKARKYVLPAIYMPLQKLNEWEKWIKISSVAFLQEGAKISKIKQRTKRIEAFKSLMEIGFHHLTLILWKIIGESLVDYKNNPKKLNDPAYTDGRIARINDAIQNWLVAIADAIAVVMALNIDILNELEDSIVARKFVELERLIEAFNK